METSYVQPSSASHAKVKLDDSVSHAVAPGTSSGRTSCTGAGGFLDPFDRSPLGLPYFDNGPLYTYINS